MAARRRSIVKKWLIRIPVRKRLKIRKNGIFWNKFRTAGIWFFLPITLNDNGKFALSSGIFPNGLTYKGIRSFIMASWYYFPGILIRYFGITFPVSHSDNVCTEIFSFSDIAFLVKLLFFRANWNLFMLNIIFYFLLIFFS